MIIAVASGKGGTGKTTIATNLAKSIGNRVQLIDCDVEAPNSHLFLTPQIETTEEVHVPNPKVDLRKCTYCGECANICRFSAIVSGVPGYVETDVVTASGSDDDGYPVSDDDDATVTITDLPSSIEVTKTADPTEVAEPGGLVGFTVRVDNTSAVDSVTIDSLIDSVHGDLDGAALIVAAVLQHRQLDGVKAIELTDIPSFQEPVGDGSWVVRADLNPSGGIHPLAVLQAVELEVGGPGIAPDRNLTLNIGIGTRLADRYIGIG